VLRSYTKWLQRGKYREESLCLVFQRSSERKILNIQASALTIKRLQRGIIPSSREETAPSDVKVRRRENKCKMILRTWQVCWDHNETLCFYECAITLWKLHLKEKKLLILDSKCIVCMKITRAAVLCSALLVLRAYCYLTSLWFCKWFIVSTRILHILKSGQKQGSTFLCTFYFILEISD
jgi:hypothetical protein